ncbi:MAG: type II toxin-antitoxin system VapC family toxin [Beijerinckiaceae bacterium]
MSIVLDASLAFSWYFEDERTPAIDAVLDQVADAGGLVPCLWRLEIANGFQMAIRRKRVDRDFRDRALRHLGSLPIIVDPETFAYAWSATLGLADRFALTLYDAAYLEIAVRRNVPLASLDQELRAAGEVLGVPLLGLTT